MEGALKATDQAHQYYRIPKRMKKPLNKYGPITVTQATTTNGKVPGHDELCPKMLKLKVEEILNLFCKIFQNIWVTEQTP